MIIFPQIGLEGQKSTKRFIFLFLQAVKILSTVHAECQVEPGKLHISLALEVRHCLDSAITEQCLTANFSLLTEVLHVSQVGSVHVSLHQHVMFACEAIATAGVFWFYNGVHISENRNSNLDMKESKTVLMDPFRCIRQRNLTLFMTPEADKIHLDCRAAAKQSSNIAKSLPINITAEGN